MTLEELLRMKVPAHGKDGAVSISPDFRVAVQRITADGVRVIIHASGHNSETLDFIVRGDALTPC